MVARWKGASRGKVKEENCPRVAEVACSKSSGAETMR